MTQRKTSQKISFAIAIISYGLALVCLVATFYLGGERGSNDPVVASFGASVVFFISVGIVLHVIGSVSLPDLKIRKEEPPMKKSR